MSNGKVGMNSFEIARKNDLMRSTFIGCRVVMTEAVNNDKNLDKIVTAVRTFNAFTEGNNPYGENDFSFFEVEGEQYFFKFDYYDENYENFEEDGRRVLTIGRAEEY